MQAKEVGGKKKGFYPVSFDENFPSSLPVRCTRKSLPHSSADISWSFQVPSYFFFLLSSGAHTLRTAAHFSPSPACLFTSPPLPCTQHLLFSSSLGWLFSERRPWSNQLVLAAGRCSVEGEKERKPFSSPFLNLSSSPARVGGTVPRLIRANVFRPTPSLPPYEKWECGKWEMEESVGKG